jgi:hypothetical protein
VFFIMLALAEEHYKAHGRRRLAALRFGAFRCDSRS